MTSAAKRNSARPATNPRSTSGRLPRHFSLPQAILAAIFLCTAVPAANAVTCNTQAQMQPADREALILAANPLAAAIAAQNLDLLQASLLPAVIADWESLRATAQSAAPLFKGGEFHLRNGYILDATNLKAAADTQFFCTNADSSMTITINLRSLPPGRYAVVIGDFPGAPLAGQLALILGADKSPAGAPWKLGGLFAREGILETHNGVWYWSHARELAPKSVGPNPSWAAWFSYDAARWLLLPVDFLSSPNLEKLNAEQMQLKSSPLDALPVTVASPADPTKTWRVTGLRLDATLHLPDLALTYEGSGLTEPLAARAEAVTVMSGLLKIHPELRESFHGLWAYAEKDGKRSYAIEQAMHDIP